MSNTLQRAEPPSSWSRGSDRPMLSLMAAVRHRPGDVVEIVLPGGGSAFGRVLRDASIAVYRRTDPTRASASPPIGSRDYLFVVGIYAGALSRLPIVGHDPSASPEDDWPPPFRVTDPISGATRIYDRGKIRPADAAEIDGLEPAAVWDLHHIERRIEAAA